MPSFTSAIVSGFGLLLLASNSNAGNQSDMIPCEDASDCPACSKCRQKGMRKGFCKTPRLTCPDIQCKTRVCTAKTTCEYVDLDDGATCGELQTCLAGICGDPPLAMDDPHMVGLEGQHIDWNGEDGGWYALVSDGPDLQMSVRLSAPLPNEFPDRQLITGFAMKYNGGHSIVIENKDPYSTETEACPDDWYAPCLSGNSLRVIVDGQEVQLPPSIDKPLPGDDAFITVTNLPAECQPFGGDLTWAATFAEMTSRRRLAVAQAESFPEWVSTWSGSTAAPTWCAKFMDEQGTAGAVAYQSKHTVFRIVTPALVVRLHHGTNHQGGEVLDDGRVLPELEFWQMNLHVEWYNFNRETVTGLLGETIRPVYDDNGAPIMSGLEATRGTVEDYRISSPVGTDFERYHE